MTWLKAVGGLILLLVGLVWIGQGLNIVPGSFMTGQRIWAVIGVVLVLGGAWLVWSAVRGRSPAMPM